MAATDDSQGVDETEATMGVATVASGGDLPTSLPANAVMLN